MKKTILISGVIFFGAVTAGCTMHKNMGNHEQMTGSTQTGMNHEMPLSSEEKFIAQMIPHHQEAVNSSVFIYNQTDNVELKQIAGSIITGQLTEIQIMSGRMQQRYPNSTYDPMYKNMMPSSVGLLGDLRDRIYMQGMMQHHLGAIKMAQQALTLELHPEVKSFAENIITVQNAEVHKFLQLIAK